MCDKSFKKARQLVSLGIWVGKHALYACDCKRGEARGVGNLGYLTNSLVIISNHDLPMRAACGRTGKEPRDSNR